MTCISDIATFAQSCKSWLASAFQKVHDAARLLHARIVGEAPPDDADTALKRAVQAPLTLTASRCTPARNALRTTRNRIVRAVSASIMRAGWRNSCITFYALIFAACTRVHYIIFNPVIFKSRSVLIKHARAPPVCSPIANSHSSNFELKEHGHG